VTTTKSWTEAERREFACEKIAQQFMRTSEGKLMCAIVRQAIMDAGGGGGVPEMDKISAIEYLHSDMPHASLAGVDADWIRRVLAEHGVGVKPVDVYSLSAVTCISPADAEGVKRYCRSVKPDRPRTVYLMPDGRLLGWPACHRTAESLERAAGVLGGMLLGFYTASAKENDISEDLAAAWSLA
jgi:hypothetical protein